MLPDKIKYVPSPEDFCRGSYTRGKKHCTAGWAIEIIERPFSLKEALGVDEDLSIFYTQWQKEARKLRLKKSGYADITTINDDKENTYEQLAQCFENTLIALGYEIYYE